MWMRVGDVRVCVVRVCVFVFVFDCMWLSAALTGWACLCVV